MSKKIDVTSYLHDILQQAMRITLAEVSVVYLEAPETDQLQLEIALPDDKSVSSELAAQVFKQQMILKEPRDEQLLVYVPIVAYEAAALGVVGFHMPGDSFSDTTEMIFKLIVNQIAVLITNNRLLVQADEKDKRLLQEHNLLLQIYDAIPTLESVNEMGTHSRHAAELYHKIGWSPVRITVRDDKKTVIAQHTLGAGSLPELTPDDLHQMTEAGGIQLGNAYFFSEVNDRSLLYIKTRASDGTVKGDIELYQDKALPVPTEQGIRPLLIFAHQFSTAIERDKLVSSLTETADRMEEHIDELEFIRKADREISSRLDPDRVVKFTLDWAMRRTAADAASLLVMDMATQELETRESLGYTPEQLKILEGRTDYGIISRAIREKTRQLVEDVSQDPDYIQLMSYTVTMLAIPLISNRRTIGAIALESSVPGRFDQNAIEFIERIAGMAAIALDNAQLLQQAEQLADDMSLIYNAGRTISSSLEWEKAIQSIAQGMALAVKGSSALVYSYQVNTQRAQLLSLYVAASQSRSITSLMPALGSLWDISIYPQVQQAVTQNQMLLINPNSPDSVEKAWLQRMEVPAAGITPLTAQGEPVGIAVLIKSGASPEFAPSEIFVAESLATQAAAVLRQASLYSEILELETLKSEMIRMASHDLRAPISNAAGYLELLELDLGENLNDDMVSSMNSIRRSLNTMQNLVDDLLTLEKIESERADVWETLTFSDLVVEVVDEQTASAQLKHQNLIPEVAGQPVLVRGNRTHLRQCIANLISNGIKYTPENGTIKVRVFTRDGRLFFETEDDGFGIAENRQKRIFQRFYRAKQPGTENIPGTGLGLSMVKTIVERHGGQISFTSTEGKGSTFTFWLPLAEDEAPISE